jgi:ABC-2 type transport system permease protein
VSVRTTALIVEREVREAARRKGIWALVAATFLASLALVVVPELLPDGDDRQVAIAGDDTIGLATALEAVDDPKIEVSTVPDREAATAAVESGDVDLAVVLGSTDATLVVEDEGAFVVDVVAGVVADRTVSARLTAEGIDADAVRAAFDDAAPAIEPVDVDRNDRQASAFVISILLYLLLVILMSQVANGVAVEKSNRVSEVLLAIVSPRSLLFGKVIGVGCIGLATLAAGAAPVIVKFAAGGDLPTGLVSSLAASSVWFVGGLALYLTTAGALGALAARQEDAGATVVPLTTLLVASYVVAISASESALSAVLAYVPLTSPLIEPYRIAIGAGSMVEYVLSAVILYASVIVVARVGVTVFRRAIVRTGRRLKLREALRS